MKNMSEKEKRIVGLITGVIGIVILIIAVCVLKYDISKDVPTFSYKWPFSTHELFVLIYLIRGILLTPFGIVLLILSRKKRVGI